MQVEAGPLFEAGFFLEAALVVRTGAVLISASLDVMGTMPLVLAATGFAGLCEVEVGVFCDSRFLCFGESLLCWWRLLFVSNKWLHSAHHLDFIWPVCAM